MGAGEIWPWEEMKTQIHVISSLCMTLSGDGKGKPRATINAALQPFWQ